MSDCSCSKQDGFANCCKLKSALARAERAEASKVMMAIQCQCEELRDDNEKLKAALRVFDNRRKLAYSLRNESPPCLPVC